MRRRTIPHFISLRNFLLIILLAVLSVGLTGIAAAEPIVWKSDRDAVTVRETSSGSTSTVTNTTLTIGALSEAVNLTPLDDPAPSADWTGTTSRGYPLSFDIASDGATWSNFKLKTNFSLGGCSGTTEITVFGPGPITNYRFNSSSGSFSFSGQFNSSTTASGFYAYINDFISGCGNFTQFGTWTANTTTTPLSLKVYLPLIMKNFDPPLPGSEGDPKSSAH
jgi:hypothetical protein